MDFALVGLFAVIFAVGAFRWRLAVMGALVLAVFEGAIRKWAFPEAHQTVYLVKDVLLLGAYARFFSERSLRRKLVFDRHPANGVLVVLSLWAVLQLVNPSLPNLWVGLFGIKAYLINVPLMYMIPSVFPDEQRLGRFWAAYLILSLVPLTLGIFQFLAPPDNVLNQYAWKEDLAPGVAWFGDVDTPKARVTGTFSYITGYTTYLLLVLLMCLTLIVYPRARLLQWGLYSLLGLGLSNLLMTGSRGPFIILGVAVIMLLSLTVWFKVPRRSWAVISICAVLPVVGMLVANAFPEAQMAFLDRVRANDDVEDRLLGIVREPLWALGALDEVGYFGYGIGSTHQATAFLITTGDGETSPPGAEGEWERIILEIGPFGFALVLLMRILVSWKLWIAFRAARSTPLAAYFIAALLFSVASIPGNLVFNHTASIFYWFLAGLALIPGEGAVADSEPKDTVHAWRQTANTR